ncbi:MAG: hypothetical protein M3Z04_11320 [Chloroflexota bacterium]|nr:hypothetical protein [Chloroflexota bacterium]
MKTIYRRLFTRLGPVLLLAAGLSVGLGAPPSGAAPLRYADAAFERVWTRTDAPVAAGQAGRSWYWGPQPGMIVREPFAGLPGGSHLVQYFDKSRMEINDPAGDRSSKWFVTNGLLTVELVSGRIQTGLSQFEERAPADIPLASDGDDANAPTYASFLAVSNTSRGDHRVADRSGGAVTAVINRAGAVHDAPSRAQDATKLAHYDAQTGHNIAGVFWQFLNASGPVRDGTATVTAPLSDPWNFATGLPISEPYWATVKIAGKPTDVLIQAFERRVLTYVPANAPQWRVQMGNIGQHYYQYRYGGPPSVLTAALARQAAAPSYHFASLIQLKTGNLLVPFARQSGDYQAPDRTHLVQQATDGNSEIVTIGPTIYANNTTLGTGWQKSSSGGGFDLSSIIGVLQYAGNVTEGAGETINGVPSRHLHMTLEPSVIPQLGGVSYTAAEADLYIARASGLLTRELTTLTLAPSGGRTGTAYVSVDFSDYGKPVQITAPIP